MIWKYKLIFIIVCILFIISIGCTINDPTYVNFWDNMICLGCCIICWFNYKSIKKDNEKLNKLKNEI